MRAAVTVIGILLIFLAGLFTGVAMNMPHGKITRPLDNSYAPAEVYQIQDLITKTVRAGSDHFQFNTVNFLVKPIAVQDCKDYGAYEIKGFSQKTETVSEFPVEGMVLCIPKYQSPQVK